MRIQNMFQKDINRPINGVIKVSSEDADSVKQELSEYIITKELRRHFTSFYDNYADSLDNPTDKIGVWISGFFGSGKSHFLKMLSYLLSNREVDGKTTLEYFADKFDDPLMYATAKRCASVPTETILFNIDIAGPEKKDKTVILRIFTKVFYDHCGYYGDDLKIATLERFVDKQGKAEEFHRVFREINGQDWLEARSSAAFFEDDIVEVLQRVLGMSETAARNWFNGEETGENNVARLVQEIKEYVDSRGKDCRLLFMIDEVGQYIGDDGDLMLNLQSIVEEIGDKLRGRVWVMVTSQEAIDSVVKITGNDFSKIQGRFDTRLSLSSSSVDEVIRKRVLDKTPEAGQLLHMVYDKDSAVLKNLFTFSGAVRDIKGYSGGDDFAANYPFVPYQFTIIQKVLLKIRQHGNAGKNLSGGERSMLSGFQEAAQKICDRDENALVPFCSFYDTITTFLESQIRRVVERCRTAADNHDGIEPQDVDVLKLLYLIRYIDDITANTDNISVLMIDDIRTDKIELRARINDSLDRLLSQNYISRSGDTYAFLTDEEQDIAAEIKNTPVDSSRIVKSISDVIFGSIYPAKKIRYGRYDFPYDQYIDETISGSSTGAIALRFVTPAGDLSRASESDLIMRSGYDNQAIVILSGDYPYYSDLEEAMKIRQYVRTKNVSQLSSSIQSIIRARNDDAAALEREAAGHLSYAIDNAVFYVAGSLMKPAGSTTKEKLDNVMSNLIDCAYGSLNMVNHFYDDDGDIRQILLDNDRTAAMPGSGADNEEALNTVCQWLDSRGAQNIVPTMTDVQRFFGSIPYGWREIDIAAIVARLIVDQKIQIKRGGEVISRDDRELVGFLRKKNETDKVKVWRRVAPSEDLMRKSIAFLREYTGDMDIPGDEDGLIEYVINKLSARAADYRALLAGYSSGNYPDRDIVESAVKLINVVLDKRRDNVALLNELISRQDELMASEEDISCVATFFSSQRAIFDSAAKMLESLVHDRDYFTSDPAALAAINEISMILHMAKPYSRIKDLSELMQTVRQAKDKLLKDKREEVIGYICTFSGDVHSRAGGSLKAEDIVNTADAYFDGKRKEAEEMDSLISLDGLMPLVQSRGSMFLRQVDAALKPEGPAASPSGMADSTKVASHIVTLRRTEICPVKRLCSAADVDSYVDGIRAKLIQALGGSDGVQVN